MADLVARLKLANSEFNTSLNDSKQKVKEFQDTADDANTSLKQMGDQGTKAAQDMLKEMGGFESGARSVTNYRKQLSDLQRQIQDLTVNYRSMSAEMQQSAKGLEIKGLIDEATAQAAQFKDAIGDVQQEIARLSSDTVIWDGMKQGIGAASGALQAFVATGVLGEKSTEKLVAVIAKLQAVEKATNAVIAIGNMLQKNSAAAQALRTIQTKLQTAATVKATAAQTGLNAAMAANPILLAVAAVAALAAGIVILTRRMKEQTDAAKYAKQAQDAYNKALKDAQTEASNSVAKFELLRQSYLRCKTEAEKTEWIDNNKEAMKDLGYKVEDVNTADEIFVEHAKDVIKAMRLRAEAAALLSVYQEEYAKAVRDSYDMEQKAAKGKKWSGGPDWKKIREAGLKEGEDYSYTPTFGIQFTPEGEKKMKEYGEKVGEAVRDGATEGLSSLTKAMEDKETEATKLDGKWRAVEETTKNTNKNAGGMGKEIKAAVGSLTEAEKKLSEMEAKFKAMNPNDTGFDKMKQDVEAQRKLVEELKKQYEQIIETQTTEFEKIKQQKKEAEELLAKLEPLSDEWKAQLNEVIKLESKIKDIEAAVESYKKRLNTPMEMLQPIIGSNPLQGKAEYKETLVRPLNNQEKAELYKDAQQAAAKIQEQFDLGLIGEEQAKNLVNAINNTLEKEGIKLKVSVDTETLAKSLRETVANLDKIGSLSNGVTAINSIYEAITGLQDKLDEAANGWESFFAVFQTGMTVFSSITTIIETFATALELLNTVKAAGIGVTTKETGAVLSSAAAHGENATAALGDAAAEGALAAAEGGASVAKIPYVGGFIAAGIIGVIMGAIIASLSKAQSFAKGGIVGGSSFSGDKILTRLNSGEMVLNDKQQNKLWDFIEGGGSTRNGDPQNVTFRISGTDLVGTFDNYNRKRAKI